MVGLRMTTPAQESVEVRWPEGKSFTTVTIIERVRELIDLAAARGIDINGARLTWIES